MSSNRNIKLKMIAKYGEDCWIDKLHLRPAEDTPRKYSSKGQLKRMKQLTFHHIKERSKGGRATEENGALLSAENHEWFNKQPKEVQDKLNQIFQEYKKSFNQNHPDSSTSEYDTSVSLSYDKVISLAKSSYNRAKDKREARKRIQEDLNDLEL